MSVTYTRSLDKFECIKGIISAWRLLELPTPLKPQMYSCQRGRKINLEIISPIYFFVENQ